MVEVAAGSFADLMRFYRDRRQVSRNQLAHEAGVDPSYLTRIEQGGRNPPRREIVDALARCLRCSERETAALMVAAGHAPDPLRRLGCWPEAVDLLVRALADPAMSDEERALLVTVVARIVTAWHQAAHPVRGRMNGRTG